MMLYAFHSLFYVTWNKRGKVITEHIPLFEKFKMPTVVGRLNRMGNESA